MADRVRMLIIDDSKVMRRYLSAIASDLGYEADEAVDGLDAIEKMKSSPVPYGVALVDWDMPRMNGIEFVDAVRKNEEWASVKLLMVTARVAMGEVSEALALGADDYLMKPLTEEMVASKLQLLGF